MRLKRYVIFIVLLILCSCKQKKDFKQIDFHEYTIDIPNDWQVVNAIGIDSQTDILITSRGDSIYFDFGKYSKNFNETNKVFNLEQILKYDSLGMDIKELFYSDTPEVDQMQGTFLQEYYYYDTINGEKAKIKVPKQFKDKGEIGICFHNIGENSLTVLAENLTVEEQMLLLKVFKSIKFK